MNSPSKGSSLIICCHNSSPRLRQTLEHLRQQNLPRHINCEAILVDNGSTDGTGELALSLWPTDAPFPLRVVLEPKVGLSYARIKGFQEAQYEYVSFVDDDNWLTPNWVVTAYKTMESSPKIGACGGQTIPVFESQPPEWFQNYQELFAVGAQSVYPGDITQTREYLWGAGITIRKQAWDFLINNGFKPILTGRKGKTISSGEDVEICYALRLAGWQLWYEPELVLYHYMPASRLRWDYLKKIYYGNGAMSVVLSIYKSLEKNLAYDTQAGRLGKIWPWKLYAYLLNFLKLVTHTPMLGFKLSEGDERDLAIRYAAGKICEILRLRNKFDAYVLANAGREWVNKDNK